MIPRDLFTHAVKFRSLGLLDLQMWLMGCPNPYKMHENSDCTFLKVFTHSKTKRASKFFSLAGFNITS